MATKINNTFIVSEQGDTLKELLIVDPTDKNSSSGVGRFKNLKVTNTSNQPAEVQVEIMDFTSGDNAAVGDVVNCVLNANETISFPNPKVILYTLSQSAGFANGSSGAGNTSNFAAPESDGTINSGCLLNGAYTAAGKTLTVDDSDYFKVNDYIKLENEIMKVTAINSATVIAVDFAQLGTTNADHADDTAIQYYFLNEVGDSFLQTNNRGFYSATNFFGKARNSAMPMGLVPGSIAIQFADAAYQEFGLSDQTSNTQSGLTASTIYSFNIQPDNAASATQIDFTTDSSNTNWGGSNGVLEKINDQFLDKWRAGTFTYLPTISIVNGDIRVTSGSRIFGGATAGVSKIVLAAPTSGTTMFGVKRIPAVGDLLTAVDVAYPGNTKSRASEYMFDDGHGVLSGGLGSGTIDYDTGAIEFVGVPHATFKYAAYFNSALSGNITASADNYIRSIKAKSLNAWRDATINIQVDDEGVDDSTAISQVGGATR